MKLDQLKVLNLIFTKILLDATIANAELDIPNFILLRNDRTRHIGGCCTCIYVYYDLIILDSLHIDGIETHWCYIKSCSGNSFFLGCRPPSSNIQCSNKITDNIEIAISLNKNIVILGDFNIDVSDCNHPCSSKYQSICDLFDLTYSLP